MPWSRLSCSLAGVDALNSIGKLISLCADLVEAEGRLLRVHMVRVAIVLTMVVIVGVLGLGGVGMLLGAVYFAVAAETSPSTGLFVCSIITFLIAMGLAWLIRRIQD